MHYILFSLKEKNIQLFIAQYFTEVDSTLHGRFTDFLFRARFLSLARSKLRLRLANHRAGYLSNLACDWLSMLYEHCAHAGQNYGVLHSQLETIIFVLKNIFVIQKLFNISDFTTVKWNLVFKPIHRRCDYWYICRLPAIESNNILYWQILSLHILNSSAVADTLEPLVGQIFGVEFQRYPLKFQAKHITQTLKDMIRTQHWNFMALRFKNSYPFLNPTNTNTHPLLSQVMAWYLRRQVWWVKWQMLKSLTTMPFLLHD